MNERIRELVRQAVESVDIVTGNESLDDELAKMYIPDCFSEKFAELIVRECLKICQNHPSIIFKNEWDADVVAPDIVNRLESHFGVEE